MIPKWQMAALFALALLAVALGICNSPNSFAYSFLSGRCNREPDSIPCHMLGRHSGFIPNPQSRAKLQGVGRDGLAQPSW
jgi:hypothetical protein